MTTNQNRVTSEDVDAAIVGTEYLTPHSATHVTIAVTRLQNGYIVVGTSAPSDPSNYDENVGRRMALQDCMRQIWPLLGFQIRERLFAEDMRHLMKVYDES